MFTLVEECMRRVGLHHQTLPGFTRVPLSDTLVVPIPDRQIAFQHIEKLWKGVQVALIAETPNTRVSAIRTDFRSAGRRRAELARFLPAVRITCSPLRAYAF